MKKSILWIIGLLFVTSFSIVSCDETDGAVDPYFNWEERNQLYIDSIARVANANLGNEVGQWKVIHTWKFNPPINDLNPNVNDYVYCKVLEKGMGITPLFTDTVSVNYRGKLIPLYGGEEIIFDQNYKGDLNPDIAIPSKMVLYGVEDGYVSQLVDGWQTALMQMKVGDRWLLYVPSDLGYGDAGSTGIPGYSTLVFDVRLDNVYPLK